MQIHIVGTGYVGLVTGACLTRLGHTVICSDIDAPRVAAINRGEAPFYEPGLSELLQAALAGQKLHATLDLRDAVRRSEATLIAVGTPLRQDVIDLSFVAQAADQIGKALREHGGFPVVAVKSTVIPGTTDGLVRNVLEKASGLKAGVGFGLCMNPEFLREGSAVGDFLEPDRIVIGEWDARSGDVMARVYQGLDAPVIRTGLRNAELIKYASNALLATMVSFSNEIASLCESSEGLDVDQVLRAVHLDRRFTRLAAGETRMPELVTYLRAGCGFGGSCLPKDVGALRAFATERGVTPSLLNAVLEVNASRPARLIAMAETALGTLQDAEIAVLGLAFKPGTDDLRDSPALQVVRGLLAKGARVRAYDPLALEAARRVCGNEVQLSASFADTIHAADAAIVPTACPELLAADWSALCRSMRRPVIVDGRNALRHIRWEPATTYLHIGEYPGQRDRHSVATPLAYARENRAAVASDR